MRDNTTSAARNRIRSREFDLHGVAAQLGLELLRRVLDHDASVVDNRQPVSELIGLV